MPLIKHSTKQVLQLIRAAGRSWSCKISRKILFTSMPDIFIVEVDQQERGGFGEIKCLYTLWKCGSHILQWDMEMETAAHRCLKYRVIFIFLNYILNSFFFAECKDPKLEIDSLIFLNFKVLPHLQWERLIIRYVQFPLARVIVSPTSRGQAGTLYGGIVE